MSGRKKRTQASQGSKGNPAASSEADGPAQDYEDPFGDVYDEEDVEALMVHPYVHINQYHTVYNQYIPLI